MATHWTLGCDATDPPTLARFWALALGYVIEPGFDRPDNTSIIDPAGIGPAIGFLRVPEPKTSKNRVHLDIRVGREAEDPRARARLVRDKVRELVAAGAVQVREELYEEGELGHTVMLDPEGNEFCVA